MGCDNYAKLLVKDSDTAVECLSICFKGPKTSNCIGLNCCQTTLYCDSNSFTINMTSVVNKGDGGGCRTAFVIDRYWFAPENLDVLGKREYVPEALKWGTEQGSCDISESSTNSFCSKHGFC